MKQVLTDSRAVRPWGASLGGFAALLVLLVVALFGLLAGAQSLTVISLCSGGRALDVGTERLLLERQVQRAIEEAVLQQWESRSESPVPFEEELSRQLGRVAASDLHLSLVSPLNLPSIGSDFPEGGASQAFAEPSQALLSRCGPELRVLCGSLVQEGSVEPLGVMVTGATWPAQDGVSLNFEYQVLRMPLSGFGDLAYDLPDELKGPVPGVAPLAPTGGLARERDSARRTDLSASGAGLPFQFRRRASIATAMARVFSRDYVQALARLAGPSLVHRLDLPSKDTAQLSGLVRTPGGANLDLALAGEGNFGGQLRQGALLVIASNQPGQQLVLSDSGLVEGAPLLLLVIGAGGLRVQLGSCRRPVLLIGSKIDLVPDGGAWAGGVMLGPGCRVLVGSAPVTLSHFAHHAGDGLVLSDCFQVKGVPDARVASLSPTLVCVNCRSVSHEP